MDVFCGIMLIKPARTSSAKGFLCEPFTPLSATTRRFIGPDRAGTVLYCDLTSNNNGGCSAAEVAGLSFYADVAPFTNVDEFHEHLEAFAAAASRHAFLL